MDIMSLWSTSTSIFTQTNYYFLENLNSVIFYF